MPGSKRLLACVLSLLSLRWALSQRPPNLGGEWEITYSFSERRADRGNFVAPPPCRGPFPYYHTYIVDMDAQQEGSDTLRYCYRGTDCTVLKFEITIQEGNADLLEQKCQFRPYRGYSDFGLVPYADAPMLTDTTTGLEGEDCEQQNPTSGYPCHMGPLLPHGVAEDHSMTLGKVEEPYLFQQFHVAPKPPFLWGSFCKQYNWPEVDIRGRNLHQNGAEYFGGAWRNENETWVFVKDITRCSCYPECAECSERVPGTINMRRVMTGAAGLRCLRKYGADDSDCDWVLHGVTGGAMLYYGDAKLENGEYQRCYLYATIYGVRRTKNEPSKV